MIKLLQIYVVFDFIFPIKRIWSQEFLPNNFPRFEKKIFKNSDVWKTETILSDMTCILEFVKCETKMIFQIEFIKSLFCTHGFLDTNFDELSANSVLFQQDFEILNR